MEKPAAVPDSLTGINGALVHVFEHAGLWVCVSVFDADVLRLSRENISKHEAVVRAVLQETTPLPFRFGTVLPRKQIESYLSARNAVLKTNLARVRNAVEMSVKIIWSKRAEDPSLETLPKPSGAGATFLFEKKRELLGDERLEERAKQIKKWLQLKLKEFVCEELITLRPNAKLVLAASYLVKRDLVSAYLDRLRRATAERPELHFLTSGPWAPYSFANIELEFKTHFGVS